MTFQLPVPPLSADVHIAILAGPAFEDRELFYPLYRFREAGATVRVLGIGEAHYLGKYGVPVTVDAQADDVTSQRWHAVIVPGGWAPDKIRMNAGALTIVQNTLQQSGVVGSICHGGWVLASAKVLQARRVTSYIAIKDDMIHAGAHWEDAAVLVDQGSPDNLGQIVTSRTPDDLPDFCRAILSLLI